MGRPSLARAGITLLALGCCAPTETSAASPFTYGHAAYAYGPLHCTGSPCDVVPACNQAHWAKDIEAFNSDTSVSNAAINQIYTYGGDVEFWPAKTQLKACWAPADPTACNASAYYNPQNRKAAGTYASAAGVESVTALIDGRMDGWAMIQAYGGNDACGYGDFYPSMNNLSIPQIARLAQSIARMYCPDPNLGGIQVDLQPYQEPYKQNLEAFVTALALELRDSDGANGCKTAKHPAGRTISYFSFAHQMSKTFYNDTLGANGIYVFSGYDLKPKPGLEYNSVTEFGNNLEAEIGLIPAAIGPNGKFSLALPFSASQHEYEHYVPMHGDGCGPACRAYDSGATMDQYVQKAMDVVTDPKWGELFKVKQGGQFIGLSFWQFTYDNTYPPMKWFNNLFLPATPSSTVLQTLKKELPKLQG